VGTRPVGIRTPSPDFSPATLAIARDMGLQYDSSLMADVDCYELLLDGQPTGLVELPVEALRDDATYFDLDSGAGQRPSTPPADVFDVFRRELDAAYREGGIFQVTLHPHLSGHRSRIWILEELILHARNLGRVWFATHAEIARHVRQEA
jgi:peptidoglycan/xylan/chitin deacetylase (PgdA/CDA1 family)